MLPGGLKIGHFLAAEKPLCLVEKARVEVRYLVLSTAEGGLTKNLLYHVASDGVI